MAIYIDLLNNGAAQLDLANVTLRYYFTADGSTALVSECDYAAYDNGLGNVTCQSVSGTFVPLGAGATKDADTYLQLSFSSNPLPSGAGVRVQIRVHDATYAVMFDRTNDWSYLPPAGGTLAYVDTPNITAYVSGTKVWGVEP